MTLNIIVVLSFIISVGALAISYVIGIIGPLQLFAVLLPYIAIYYFTKNNKVNVIFYNLLVSVAVMIIGFVISFAAGTLTVQELNGFTHLVLISIMSVWFLLIGMRWLLSAVKAIWSGDKERIRDAKIKQVYFLSAACCSELSTLLLLIAQRPKNLMAGGVGHMIMILCMYIFMCIAVRGRLDNLSR